MVELRINFLHWWKRIHFNPVAEIMRHMVETLELRIRDEQAHYAATPRRIEHWDLGDERPRQVEFHGPFNSEAWDLDELVGIYQPSLQRGAALFTLCAGIEDELFGLCKQLRMQDTRLPDINKVGKSVSEAVFRGRGVQKALAYLDHIIEVDPLAPLLSRRSWQTFSVIQEVRNQFAHQNGRAPGRAALRRLGPEVSSLSIGRWMTDDKLVLSERYLANTLDTIEQLADDVQTAVTKRYP